MSSEYLKLAFGEHSLFWNDNDALSVTSRLLDNTVVSDRFGYLNQFSPWNIVPQNTIFPRSDYTGSIDDIIFRRGVELVQLAKETNKLLYITWSGGVDSTAVVLSILHAANGDYGNIKIIYTSSSVDEFSSFYDYLKSFDGLELIKVLACSMPYYWHTVAKTDYLVTGMPADQLFGSMVGEGYLNRLTDWKGYIDSDLAIMQFEAAFSHYNMTIKKLNEFLWLMNFMTKWTVVCNIIPWTVGLHNGNTISFFNTPEFQDWSVSNFDRLHIYDQVDKYHYKRDLKNFIYSLFKDRDYQFKGKTGSIAYSLLYDGASGKGLERRPFISILKENDIIVTKTKNKLLPVLECVAVEEIMMNTELAKYRRV